MLARKSASREQIAANTTIDLPGDPLLERSVAWSKQNPRRLRAGEYTAFASVAMGQFALMRL